MSEDYSWRENAACFATYKILEGDKFLDLFEDSTLPFEKAGSVELGSLRYFPKTTTNKSLIKALSFEIAGDFLKILAKVYVVDRENKESSSEIIASVASAFANPKLTIADLAGVIDGQFKFPDEA